MTSFLRRLRNLLRDERHSADIDREMDFHLEERADDLAAHGLPPEAAALEARRRFGNRTRMREDTREAGIVSWIASLMADVRYALRTMLANRAFSLVVVLSLALGIGANTAIFSLVNAVLLRSLPVSHPNELVLLTGERPTGSGARAGSYTNPIWEALRDQQPEVAQLYAYGDEVFDLASGGPVRRIQGNWVSGGFFNILQVQPAAGRLLQPADDVRGCAPVAVLSHAFAAREFGSAREAVGRSIPLNRHPFTIVGVTGPGFFGVDVGQAPSIFVPLCAEAAISGENSVLDQRSTWFLRIMGRLKPGVTLAATQARLDAVAPAIYAATLPPNWGKEARESYLKRSMWAQSAPSGWSALRGNYGEALTVLLIVVGAVLLIACVNVAHLLLARATARQREMAVRLAMGAGRRRLIRQLLTESLLLAVSGALLGMLLARWATALMVRFLSTRSDAVWLDLSPDLRVLGFTIAIAVLTGVLFGLVPALRATRVDPQTAMRAQGRGTTQARLPIAKALVVVQIGLSLVLVVAATLLVGSFRRLITLDPGFRRDGVLLATVDFGSTDLDSAGQATTRRALLERMREIPGVRSAAASYISPISGSGWNEVVTVGTDTAGAIEDHLVWFNTVSEGWFETMGTAVRAGRDFGPDDGPGSARVAIINETMARKYFPGTSPLGKGFSIRRVDGAPDAPLLVVGVVADAKYDELSEDPSAIAYVPMTQGPWFGNRGVYELRTDANPYTLAASATSVTSSINSSISLEFTALADQVSESLRRPRLLATLSGFFGALALLLAVIGLYGTMAYGVARRRSDIGIRLALGAARVRVVAMILKEAGGLIVGGAILGVVGAFAATRLVKAFLYGVTPTDPGALGLSVALLGIVALAAAALPAWRASTVDPAQALRNE